MSRVVVIASHRRAGTHLTIDSFRTNGTDVNRRFLNLDRIEPTHPTHIPIEDFDRTLHSGKGTVLVKTHALPGPEAWQDPAARDYAGQLLATSPIVYVHRDGRDVLVSLYHYVGSYSAAARDQSFAAFIRSAHPGKDIRGLSRAAYWQHHVLTWLDHQPTVLSAFEALRADPGSLAEIAPRVGVQPRATIREVTLERRGGRRGRIGRLLARVGLGARPPSSAILPRAGRSGGWRAAFDEADLEWFDAEAGEAMRRLGYA